MDYKALEDLVNILVKKTGTELNADVVNYQKTKLEDKSKKIKNDITNFGKSLNSKKYYDNDSKEKDEQKFIKKNEEIKILEDKILNYESELESYNKLTEFNNTEYEYLLNFKKSLDKEILELKREIRINQLESNDIRKLEAELNILLQKQSETAESIIRKSFLEEETEILKTELRNLKEVKDFIKSKLDSDNYYKGLDKVRDEETLKTLKSEEQLVEICLDNWESNAELCGKEILEAYKSGETFGSVKEKIEYLVSTAVKELSKTHKEIDNSNIFKEMDKYVRLTSDLSEKITTGEYHDFKKQEMNKFAGEYHDKKLKSLNEKKNMLESQISSLERLIKEITSTYDNVKNNRLYLKEELDGLEERFYNSNLKKVTDKEMREIESLISTIKEEITSSLKEEGNYLKDINKYKCELSKKSCELSYTIREIENEDNFERNNGNTDLLESLNDKILLIEYQNRLDSISKQQQYLYVDPDVIKEEIEVLWNRKNKITDSKNRKDNKNIREIIENDVIEPEILQIEDAPDILDI